MTHRCAQCSRPLVGYREWVKRGAERRKLLFYGCLACPGEWRPLDDMEFFARKPLRKAAAIAEAILIVSGDRTYQT